MKNNIIFIEDNSPSYSSRTMKNAQADATIAFACDFTTAGEKLTKSAVKSCGKKYIAINANDRNITADRIEQLLVKLNSIKRHIITINKEEYYPQSIINDAILTSNTFLSNFYQLENPIIDEYGFPYWNSEGYYMALRTKEKHIRFKISEMSKLGGAESRKARKLFKGLLDMNEDQRLGYMRLATFKKFKNNPNFAVQLQQTENKLIVELNSWKDNLFGVTEDNNKGANLLGKCLMECRDQLNGFSLNIAGNGLYSVKDTFTQEQCDKFVFDFLNLTINDSRFESKIISLRTGGQSGFDEAGAKAGAKLNIPTRILSPKGWRFRNIDGEDINNEQLFKQRFYAKD